MGVLAAIAKNLNTVVGYGYFTFPNNYMLVYVHLSPIGYTVYTRTHIDTNYHFRVDQFLNNFFFFCFQTRPGAMLLYPL